MSTQIRSSAQKESDGAILTTDVSQEREIAIDLPVEEPIEVVFVQEDCSGGATPDSQAINGSRPSGGCCEGCTKLQLEVERMKEEIESLKRTLNFPAEATMHNERTHANY